MAIPSDKTLRTVDFAVMRFHNDAFTREAFEEFLTEMKKANFEVAAFSTLQRYGYIVAQHTKKVIATYSPTEFAAFVNGLMGIEDLYDWNNNYEWDETNQVFKEYATEIVYHLEP